MKNRSWFAFATSVVIGAAALATLPAPAAADDAACGSKDNPCPLQKWMRARMGSAGDDLPTLAKALDDAVGLAPDASWATKPDKTGWADIAKGGADAARKGDLAATKAACKACHNTWKDPYKAKFRTKPLP